MTTTQASPDRSPRAGLRAGFALLALLLALLPLLPPVELLELKWLDQQFRWLRDHAPIAAKHEVVIVGIDEETPRRLNVPLAIMHAQLGAAFAALADAAPLAVGVDIALPEQSFDSVKTGLDAALARGILQLRSAAPLVLGVTVDGQGRARPLHRPFAALAGEAGLGYVLVPLDADNALRRFDERLGTSGEVVPTLAGQIARRLGIEPRAGIVQFALGPRLNYVPLQQLLAWQEAGEAQRVKQAFAGRIVLFGSVMPYEDRHRVPVALADWEPDARFAPGVAVHAQQVLTLVEGRMVAALPPPLTMLVAALAAAAWWLRPGRAAAALTALVVAATLVAGPVALRAGMQLPTASWSLCAVLALAARAGYHAWLGLREKRWLRAAFTGWVSPAVLREILAGRLAPGLKGVRRDVCVMFCDIRQFTHLSESLPPEQVTALLNRYFNHMAEAIHRRGGTIDKFIGDGIMAFFGAPQESADPCRDAFAAAQEMLQALARFNRELASEGRAGLAFGIGLHYGPAVIGYVGAVERYEYTAIGDTVNTASRIEGLTKELRWPVLLSRAVADRVDAGAGLTPLGEHAVKGRAAVEVFGWRCARTDERETT